MRQLRLPSSIIAAGAAAGLMVAVLAPAGAQAAAAGLVSTARAAPPPRSAAQEAGAGAKLAGCAKRTGPRRARCYLSVQPAGPRRAASSAATACTVNQAAGYTPCNLRAAYELTSLSAKDGYGNTVAVVDPNDDPNAAADLNVYRSTYGLPKCTTGNGCFTKVNQAGVAGNYPAPDAGFAQEASLDLDMVSAICPHCRILLVEASSNGFGDLGTAVGEAVTLGARVVSDSWGTGEFNGETGYDGYFEHPGVAITFSSGDGAYAGGVQYPSASPYVTSVGGTELTPASNSRGWTEAAWVTPGTPPTQGSGSGCSAYEPKPPWQADAGCAARTTADVSAVAVNVLSYDTYQASGWYFSFGTSVSAPIIAGAYGLADNAASITIPASAAYSAPATARHDITSGSTGTCTPPAPAGYLCKAVKGYDGPTGLGSPHGIGAFQVPGTPPPSISGVAFSGTPADPAITITGTGFGPSPPIGTPESCQSGDTGDDYGSAGLWFSDATQGGGRPARPATASAWSSPRGATARWCSASAASTPATRPSSPGTRSLPGSRAPRSAARWAEPPGPMALHRWRRVRHPEHRAEPAGAARRQHGGVAQRKGESGDMARTYWLGPARRGRRAGQFPAMRAVPEVAGLALRQHLREVKQTAPFFGIQAGDPVKRFAAGADRHPVLGLTAVPAGG